MYLLKLNIVTALEHIETEILYALFLDIKEECERQHPDQTMHLFQLLQNIYKILSILVCPFIIMNTVKITEITMKKILVIEDKTAINNLICMNLEITGYDPVVFFDVIITVPRVGYRMEVSE